MTVDDIKSYFGSYTKAAAAVGMSRMAINYWRVTGVIPAFRQLQYQEITNGVLIADSGSACKKNRPYNVKVNKGRKKTKRGSKNE